MGYLKHHPKIKSYYIFLSCFVLIGFGFLYLNNMLESNNDKALVVGEMTELSTTRNVSDLSIDMTSSKSWDGEDSLKGAQYDGFIINRLNQEVTDWRIEIKVPEGSRFDGGWNGVYIYSDGSITITPVDYNTVIKPDSQDTSFGFILYTPGSMKEVKMRIEGYRVYELKDFKLFWLLVGLTFFILILWIAYFISDY